MRLSKRTINVFHKTTIDMLHGFNLCCLLKVLLVSSSRHPDQWIVPGGGMEPEEEPCGAAVREVFEEVNKLNLFWSPTLPTLSVQ